MKNVLNAEDFATARAVKEAQLKELGHVSVCMAPGEAAPGHSHTLVEEMVIVQKGLGQIQIEDTTYDLHPGSVAIVPAGKFHALCNVGSDNLEAITVFNRNVDRDKVVLKNRKQHFADKQAGSADLMAEVKQLRETNKKLKKKLKKK